MPFMTVNDTKIYYQSHGEGPDVVLIHGMGGNMSYWHGNTALATLMSDFRVTTYDLKGHGYSTFAKNGYTSLDLARELNDLMENLGLEKAYLVGHSYGGLIALNTAIAFPERVAGMVLAEVSVPALLHLVDLKDWPYREALVTKLRNIDPELPDLVQAYKMYFLEYAFRNSDKKLQHEIENFGMRKGLERRGRRALKLLDETTAREDMRNPCSLSEEIIARVDQPTLALYGQYSPLIPVANFLAENLARCTKLEVPKAGHLFPATLPDTFVRITMDFLLALKAGTDFDHRMEELHQKLADVHAADSGREFTM